MIELENKEFFNSTSVINSSTHNKMIIIYKIKKYIFEI